MSLTTGLMVGEYKLTKPLTVASRKAIWQATHVVNNKEVILQVFELPILEKEGDECHKYVIEDNKKFLQKLGQDTLPKDLFVADLENVKYQFIVGEYSLIKYLVKVTKDYTQFPIVAFFIYTLYTVGTYVINDASSKASDLSNTNLGLLNMSLFVGTIMSMTLAVYAARNGESEKTLCYFLIMMLMIYSVYLVRS